eukprot:SAG11_NODE_2194_length_3702_cov_1.574799_3_plen_374_part_00
MLDRQGYLPDAVLNAVGLCGWSPRAGTTNNGGTATATAAQVLAGRTVASSEEADVLTLPQMVERFRAQQQQTAIELGASAKEADAATCHPAPQLVGFSHGAAQLSRPKLDWINAQHLRRSIMAIDALPHCSKSAEEPPVCAQRSSGTKATAELWLQQCAAQLLRQRVAALWGACNPTGARPSSAGWRLAPRLAAAAHDTMGTVAGLESELEAMEVHMCDIHVAVRLGAERMTRLEEFGALATPLLAAPIWDTAKPTDEAPDLRSLRGVLAEAEAATAEERAAVAIVRRTLSDLAAALKREMVAAADVQHIRSSVEAEIKMASAGAVAALAKGANKKQKAALRRRLMLSLRLALSGRTSGPGVAETAVALQRCA